MRIPRRLLSATPVSALRPQGANRASDTGLVCTVFGASSNLARPLVYLLADKGTQVVAPFRGHGEETRHLKMYGELGVVNPVYFDLRDEESVFRAVERSDVVVNLVGRFYPTRNYSLHDANAKSVELIAEASKMAGVKRFLHVSALGASPDAPSEYLRAKHDSEQVVRRHFPDSTIYRPGRLFSIDDLFLNGMASMLKYTGWIPVVGNGEQRVQPVFAHDVARAMLLGFNHPDTFGQTYELGGPRTYSYNELIDLVERYTELDTAFADMRDSMPIPVSDLVSYATASFNEFFPREPKVFSRDMLKSMTVDQVVSPDALTFEDLGLKTTPLEEEIRKVLWKWVRRERFLHNREEE